MFNKVIICGLENECANFSHKLIKEIEILDAIDMSDKIFRETYKYDKDILYIALSEIQYQYIKDYPNVLRAYLFENETFHDPLDKWNDKIYNGIIMGMSHSQCAIDTKKIESFKMFKMSSPSMDIFLQKEYFYKLSSNYNLKNLERIVIEIPYYIFNYDLSKFGNFVLTKLYYFQLLDKFHHLEEMNDFNSINEEFKLFSQIVNKEDTVINLQSVSEVKLYYGLKRVIRRIYHIYKYSKINDKVWNNTYKDTINENINIFHDLIKSIKINCPKAEIILLIMPFNPAFILTHRKQITKNKKLFYSIINNIDATIIDDFKYFTDSSYFNDHCHMNALGSQKYMKRLNDILKS